MQIGLILSSFARALGQMGDPRFRRVLLLGVGLALAGLIALTALVVWLAEGLFSNGVTLPLIGHVGWVNDALGIGGFLGMMVLSVFLMVPVASAISGFFLEEVAEAVEDKHYSWLPGVAGVPFWEGVVDAVSFFGVIVVANIIALILYVFLAPLAAFIFWGLNGYLLGREYFTLAAMRREGAEGARILRQKHAATIWLGGILMAIPLSVPLLNLVIPIVGAATFTHIYHGLAREGQRA